MPGPLLHIFDLGNTVRERVDKLLDLAIKYPELENDDLAMTWGTDKRSRNSEDGMRYDNYCCFVFNLIEDIFELENGNPEKMYNHLTFQELLFRHRVWWTCEPENVIGYNKLKGFKQFVATEIESANMRNS